LETGVEVKMQQTSEKEKANHVSLLLTPGFVGGLGLLLLNDLFLKPTFQNWLTGKLSDFAGLFIFPLFFVALFPWLKRPVYFATAAFFLLWKSVYVRPLIDWWNQYTPITLGRVEDPTDILALLALPLSYRYESRVPNKEAGRLAASLICLISIFAFTATSFRRVEQSYSNEYHFLISQAELLDRIERVGKVILHGEGKMMGAELAKRKELHRGLPSTYVIQFRFDATAPQDATVVVSEDKGLAKISLMKIMGERNPRAEQWRSYFEKEFITLLKQEVISASPKIASIMLVD
jgi:hypothetical protein